MTTAFTVAQTDGRMPVQQGASSVSALDLYDSYAGTAPAFFARELSVRDFASDEWDAAMLHAGGTMRSAHGHLIGLRRKHPFRHTVRSYGLYISGDPGPVGYFTVKRVGKVRHFHDGILLNPEYAARWPEALAAALTACGPGRFRYGWAWSLEVSREAALRCTPDVQVVDAAGIVIQGIDFSRWPTWQAYCKDLSQNSRRNAKKVAALYDDLAVSVRRRSSSLRDVLTLVRLRRDMYRRKSIAFKPRRAVLAYLVNAVVCPSQAIIATVSGGGEPRAAMQLVEFGTISYYTNGAAAADSEGAAWYLTLDMVERAFQASATGKFLMGFYIVGSVLAEGLIRSRNAMRVSEWSTTIVTFDWQPTR